MRDEQLEILMNVFGLKKGLSFMSFCSPISKQSKNKIKKEITKQALQKRTSKLASEKLARFFKSEIGMELTFGIDKRRLGKRKNDIDNLIKHSLDCLNGVLFEDDSQIREISAKIYFVNQGVKESTGIRVWEIIK